MISNVHLIFLILGLFGENNELVFFKEHSSCVGAIGASYQNQIGRTQVAAIRSIFFKEFISQTRVRGEI